MPPRPVLKYRHRHKSYLESTGHPYTPYDPDWRPRQFHRPRHQSTQMKRMRARLRADRRKNAAGIIARAYRLRYQRRVIAPQIRATQRSNLQFYHDVRDYDRGNAANQIARAYVAARPAIARRRFWSRWNSQGSVPVHSGSYHPELR